MFQSLNIAFFGSSLTSSLWNGAATYYRGLLRALAERGHRIVFYEADILGRREHRDIDPPEWAEVIEYQADQAAPVLEALNSARHADLVVKASGIGAYDTLMEESILALRSPDTMVCFWDVDAPATLERIARDRRDPFRPLIARYDAIFTYGGGDRVVSAYRAAGARHCFPIYNALDPEDHHPVPAEDRFQADLAFLGNRLPDREARVDQFFFEAARRLPAASFLLGGSGWESRSLPPNVRHLGHVSTRDHNAFNVTPRAVLNITRESMAACGFSPPTRFFEAAGAGACLITDAWEGIDTFLEPGREVLVARDGAELAQLLRELTPRRAAEIGRAARQRLLREHTYAHRATAVMEALDLIAAAAPHIEQPHLIP